MRFRMFVVPALLLVVALPAQASAGGFSGVVVAKQPQRGTLLLAGAHGVGVTVRGGLAGTAVGRRVSVQGVRLDDGTIRMSRLHVLARVHSATLRGTVVRKLVGGTLLASGRTVVMIHHLGRRLASVSDHGGLQAGDVAEFRVRFDDDELVEERPPVQVGQASIVRIEGAVVSVSPLVVSVEGLPVTITLPVGVTLPAALAPGRRIELAVQIGTANTFTLVAIDEIQNENPVAQAQEVEVEGFASSSTTTQIVVNVNGTMFTFVAPTGTTLPVLPTGTLVEVRGEQQDGTVTLTRLRVEDDHGSGSGGSGGGDSSDNGSGGVTTATTAPSTSSDRGHSGSGGGGDDGGGHSGSGGGRH